MLAKTHIAFGIFLGLVLMPFVSTGNKIIFFGLIFIGALLPDIDQPDSKVSNKIPFVSRALSIFTKHRGIFHSLFLAVGLWALVYYLGFPTYASALFIGYLSHLISDGFTKNGINFLHPVAKLHLSGPIETGGTAELVIFLLIVAGIVVKVI